MGGTDSSINRQDPRIVDLSPAAFKQLYGSLDRGTGRIRVRIDPNQRGQSPSRVRASAQPNEELGSQFIAQLEAEGGYEETASTTPYIGKAGERRGKGVLQNALDAVSRAGANPLGIATGNANDIKLVANYYKANPAVTNQYDLTTNLFLRYLSGAGTKGLKVAKEQGADIYRAFEDAKRRGAEMKDGQVAVRYMATGSLGPAGGLGVAGSEIQNSLGQFWAKEMPDGSIVIKERYNFDYAPKGKDGHGKKTQLLPTSPDQVGRNLVQAGHGKPFNYTLRIWPDGRVQVGAR
jgi:hypothetical protein